MPPPLHLVEHYPIIYDHAKTKRAVFSTTQSDETVMKLMVRARICTLHGVVSSLPLYFTTYKFYICFVFLTKIASRAR